MNAAPASEGLGVDSGSVTSSERVMSACRMSGGSVMAGKEISSCNVSREAWGESHEQWQRTSNDWAYQFFTLLMDGIALRLWGSSSSSLTRCASRTGSSSADASILVIPRICNAHQQETGSPLATFPGWDSVQKGPSAVARLLEGKTWYSRDTLRAYHRSEETRQSGEYGPIARMRFGIQPTWWFEFRSVNGAWGEAENGS